VHGRVREAWRSHVRRRRVRRTIVSAGALAAVAAAIVAAIGFIGTGEPSRLEQTVASVERVDGEVRMSRDDGDARRLSTGEALRVGEWVLTAGPARAALRTRPGVSIRVDGGTRLRLLSETSVEMSAGAVYLDTGSDATTIEIKTPLGTATDIGTQFEVRLGAESLRVRVRSGSVLVTRGREPIQVDARAELTVTSKGAETRGTEPFGDDWMWAARLAPAFEANGRTVSALLEYLSREHGWELRYDDEALARDASRIVLHGSVEGLDAHDTLRVALTTAALSYRLEHGTLSVSRPATEP
jgi:hypothetical protein